jgi:hypothetical protein
MWVLSLISLLGWRVSRESAMDLENGVRGRGLIAVNLARRDARISFA